MAARLCGTRGSRTIFVPYALPGETVRVYGWSRSTSARARGGAGRGVGSIGGTGGTSVPAFWPRAVQWLPVATHQSPAAQLDFKGRIVRDQLQRLAGIAKPLVRPTRPRGRGVGLPRPDCFLSLRPGFVGPAAGGRQGHPCHRPVPGGHPTLADLYADFNVEWDGLRSVDLSVGLSSDQRLIELRTVGDAIPEIEVDIPVSIVLETGRGASCP